MSEMEPFSESHVRTPSQPVTSLVSESLSVGCQAPTMSARLCVMKAPVHHAPWRLQSSAGVVQWTVMSCVLN